jgi:VWFA-related protein
VRVRTRVVFIDTLVKDKKTGAPVSDLTRENFEVLADRKPRRLAYFSREGDAHRRPLALVLVLDLVPYDTEKYLRRTEVLESLAAALKSLAPEDEVAITAWLGDPGAPLRTLTDFTRAQATMSEALATVPSLAVTRGKAFYKDKLNSILQKVNRAVQERPNSAVVVASVTTTVAPIPYVERDEITAGLVRANVAFSPLIVDIDKKYVLLRPLLESSGRLAGDDIYGAARYVSEQTGGDAIDVHRSRDYGTALQRIIAALAARYSLGFTLDEGERDDGRMHALEVRVKARDSRGQERKLIVRARRGYYLPKPEEAIAK